MPLHFYLTRKIFRHDIILARSGHISRETKRQLRLHFRLHFVIQWFVTDTFRNPWQPPVTTLTTRIKRHPVETGSLSFRIINMWHFGQSMTPLFHMLLDSCWNGVNWHPGYIDNRLPPNDIAFLLLPEWRIRELFPKWENVSTCQLTALDIISTRR